MTEIGLSDRMLEVALLPRREAALAGMFDPIDGPLDPERHIDRMLDLILRSLLTEAT